MLSSMISCVTRMRRVSQRMLQTLKIEMCLNIKFWSKSHIKGQWVKNQIHTWNLSGSYNLINSCSPFAVTSYWVWWCLKSPASQLFTQPFIQRQIKENIKAPCHWPLWGESFTGDRWIPRTKGQQHRKCFHLMTSSCFWWKKMMLFFVTALLCYSPLYH